MKNKFYKYFFREFLSILTLIVLSLTCILWTIQAVNYLDLVTEDGHSFALYFSYSVFGIPKIFVRLLPFSFLVALIITIVKFEKDNELIILWTSGINKLKIVHLILLISISISLFQLLIGSIISPQALFISRGFLKSSELSFFPTLVKEKKFNDTVEGLTIFVDKKDANQIYHNIFIQDDGKILSSVGNTSSTIFAKRGYISNDEKTLVLHNGNIQNLKENGSVNIVKFNKTILNLSGISTKSISEPKLQETSSIKIIRCLKDKDVNIQNCKQNKKALMNIRIETNKRFGMPVFIPLMSLVCSFLLSSRKDKKIYNYNKYIYFFIGFAILSLSEIVVRYSGTSWIHTAIYYLVPVGMIPLFYFVLIRKFKYENLF